MRVCVLVTLRLYLIARVRNMAGLTKSGDCNATARTIDGYEAVPYVAGKCSVIAIMGWPPEITRYRRTRQSLSGAV